METKIVIGVGRLESVVCAVSVVPQHTPPQDAAAHRSTPRDLYSLYLAMLVSGSICDSGMQNLLEELGGIEHRDWRWQRAS